MNAQKFTQKSLEAIQDAQNLAVEYQNMQIEQQHLLLALCNQADGLIGQMLKKIASAARQDVEELLGVQVNLQCWVKVREDWRDKEQMLNALGFAKP